MRETAYPPESSCPRGAGRTDDAVAALEQALDRCRRKKNLALAKQVGDRLAQLRGEPLTA